MSEALWLHGGRVIDPSQGVDATIDVLIVDGLVVTLGGDLHPPETARTCLLYTSPSPRDRG